MKAISLFQPWATLVAIGAKTFETRSWETRYRGELAIHATKAMPRDARELCYQQPFFDVLHNAGYDPFNLPRGCIVAITDLLRVEPMYLYEPEELDEYNRAFGDWSLGRFAWKLVSIKRLEHPIPAKGSLGLWNWHMTPTELAAFLDGTNRMIPVDPLMSEWYSTTKA